MINGFVKATTKPTINGDYICRMIIKNGVQAVKKVEWENNSDTHKEYFNCYVDEWLDESLPSKELTPVQGSAEELQKLLDYINSEYEWFIDNSPEYGVIPKIISKINELLSQQKEVQGSSDAKFYCRFCDSVFTDEYDLESHVNFHHTQFLPIP